MDSQKTAVSPDGREIGNSRQPTNYPTVPRGTERLRRTLTPLYSDADIEHARGLGSTRTDVRRQHTQKSAIGVCIANPLCPLPPMSFIRPGNPITGASAAAFRWGIASRKPAPGCWWCAGLWTAATASATLPQPMISRTRTAARCSISNRLPPPHRRSQAAPDRWPGVPPLGCLAGLRDGRRTRGANAYNADRARVHLTAALLAKPIGMVTASLAR